MGSSSENSRSRKTLLLVSFLVAAILIFQAVRVWVADYRVDSNRIDQMERGAALEPEKCRRVGPPRPRSGDGFRKSRSGRSGWRFSEGGRARTTLRGILDGPRKRV
jgi:hypothetical protein